MEPFESLYLVRSAKGLKPLINVATDATRVMGGVTIWYWGALLRSALRVLVLIVVGAV